MKGALPILVLLWSGPALAGHELDGRDIRNGRALYK